MILSGNGSQRLQKVTELENTPKICAHGGHPGRRFSAPDSSRFNCQHHLFDDAADLPWPMSPVPGSSSRLELLCRLRRWQRRRRPRGGTGHPITDDDDDDDNDDAALAATAAQIAKSRSCALPPQSPGPSTSAERVPPRIAPAGLDRPRLAECAWPRCQGGGAAIARATKAAAARAAAAAAARTAAAGGAIAAAPAAAPAPAATGAAGAAGAATGAAAGAGVGWRWLAWLLCSHILDHPLAGLGCCVGCRGRHRRRPHHHVSIRVARLLCFGNSRKPCSRWLTNTSIILALAILSLSLCGGPLLVQAALPVVSAAVTLVGCAGWFGAFVERRLVRRWPRSRRRSRRR